MSPLPGDLTHNPSMRPDLELNQRPFGSQASTQSSEPHQPELTSFIFKKMSVQYPSQKNYSFSAILSSKISVPWKKQLIQGTTQVTVQIFFFATSILLSYAD